MSDTAATLVSAVSVCLLGLIGAVWRLGSKMGEMTQELRSHNQRLDRLEKHQDAHDEWHLNRGDR